MSTQPLSLRDEKSSNNRFYVASIVACYWIVSISMVYLNKILLSPSYSVPCPLFVTWYQCVITCIICLILGQLGEKTRASGKGSFMDEYPIVNFSLNVSMSVLPLSIIFVCMIALNNLCLQYVEFSFYNVARSLSIVFNVIFTFTILGKSTSLWTCATLGIVLYGFYVGIEGEINFSLLGTTAGVVASVFVSLNSIYTSKILPKVNNDKSLLLFYNNLNAAVLFLPFIGYFELQVLFDNSNKLSSLCFWICLTLTGVMGFTVGLVTVMQVKATSPLTHNISGTAKAAVQSLLAFYIWGNQATFKGVTGIFLVIVGSGVYAWVQMNTAIGTSK